MDVRSYTSHHIDERIRIGEAEVWRFTGIYGWSKTEEKRQTIHLIERLGEFDHNGWVCIGDFNLLLGSENRGADPLILSW